MFRIPSRKSCLVLVFLYASLLPGCARIVPGTAKRNNSQSASRLAETGFLFESQGRTENAIECFEEALALEPSNKRLKDKIAALKRRPEASGRSKAIYGSETANLDEVLSRHDSEKDLEFKGKAFSTIDKRFQTASHTDTDEAELDDSMIGKQTPLN